MNTLGIGSNNVNTLAGGKSKNCLGGEKAAANIKDTVGKGENNRQSPESKLRDLASKMRAEGKKTAGKIRKTANEVGHAMTGSDNEQVNCALSIPVFAAGIALESLPLVALSGTMFVGSAVFLSMRDSLAQAILGQAAGAML